jgi:hypothetical protein
MIFIYLFGVQPRYNDENLCLNFGSFFFLSKRWGAEGSPTSTPTKHLLIEIKSTKRGGT